MSDSPQGPGWWQASDGKWYPPPRPETLPVAPTETSAPASGAPSQPQSGEAASPRTQSAPDAAFGSEAGPTQPRRTGANRGLFYFVIGMVGTLVIVGVLWFVLSDGDSDGTEDATGDQQTTGATDEPEEPAGTPPGRDRWGPGQDIGEDIHLLDSGFSNYERGEGDRYGGHWGVVVENTGSEPKSIQLVGTFQDEDGNDIGEEQATIWHIDPGQIMGVGFSTVMVDDDVPIGSFEVEASERMVRPTESLPEDAVVASITEVSRNSQGWLIVDYEVESSLPEQRENVTVYAVFHHNDGSILAVDRDRDHTLPAESTLTGKVELSSADLIPGLDDETIHLYVDLGNSS